MEGVRFLFSSLGEYLFITKLPICLVVFYYTLSFPCCFESLDDIVSKQLDLREVVFHHRCG